MPILMPVRTISRREFREEYGASPRRTKLYAAILAALHYQTGR